MATRWTPTFRDAKLVVELDSWRYLSSCQSFEDSRDRDATMLMYGIATIRITYDRIEDAPDREAERLHRILEDRRLQPHG